MYATKLWLVNNAVRNEGSRMKMGATSERRFAANSEGKIKLEQSLNSLLRYF